ncbi:transferase [Chitinophaga horti]|uniref:Transferase n=1 Tax=Chitinophaga horti TaxID=2920382 RepID=A0ABY6IVW7_9BACT|nr:transferase [Chitinophaga horti]UYQ91378.1 transferase [Chitinophaga horti]
MYLLIPGRHQLLTKFQFSYLQQIVQQGLGGQTDAFGNTLPHSSPVTAVIFAVTSANHSGTRRNPLPFYLRALAIEAMGNDLGVPVFSYGIDDVGELPNFASYTIKRLRHDSDFQFELTPENTVVICSTPVLQMYADLGYRILPAELEDIATWKHHQPMPWDIVEKIAYSDDWQNEPFVVQHMLPAAYNIWRKYRQGEKVQLLFRDTMISSDGDLTETRDYNVYVRQMDDIAEMKFRDTAAYIQPGRIGDIGCAVGSWIKLAGKEEKLRESDFYGIEVSRYLYEICQQRKLNGEFENPFVFFSKKNAVTGLVFEKHSMQTIHTSSLTHEIISYGHPGDLEKFIRNRYEELAPGGIWINRDVVGPYDKEQQVQVWLNAADGSNDDPFRECDDRHTLSAYLETLSTQARFLRFARDFREPIAYTRKGEHFVMRLRDAAEFLSRKDYTDNWQSEMHETFCYWDFNEWQQQMTAAGFSIHPASKAFTNDWIAAHRWKGKVALFNADMEPMEWPVTTMFLMGVKA